MKRKSLMYKVSKIYHLHTNGFNDALKHACQIFEGKIKGKPAFGWHKKSIGHKFVGIKDKLNWLSISKFESYISAQRYIERIGEADKLKGMRKPSLIEANIWEQEGQYIVASLMSYIPEPTCSKTSHLENEIILSKKWLSQLKTQLDSLVCQPTDYVSCRQDLINRRLQERYGNINCHIDNWATIHGDLNWSNLTTFTPYILDWEGWGKGPLGLDIAFLYCFSLNVKSVSSAIKSFFHEWFSTQGAQICLLFSCSELLRMTELYDDHPTLYTPLLELSQEILKSVDIKL